MMQSTRQFPFRAKKQPDKMMADGGSVNGGLGMPEPIGGGGPPAAPAKAPAAPPAMDPDQDNDMDTPVIKPEAVNFHDGPQVCGKCMYFGKDGQCAVLKMEVAADSGCTAFEDHGGGEEEQSEPDGDEGMEGMEG